MHDPTVLDLHAIDNLRALNPGDHDEFLREITAIFIEDTPQRIQELDQCLALGDAAKFSRAAHSIKGSSANLGAIALRLVAERLEQQSRTNGLADVALLVASLKVEFERTRIELSRLLSS